MKVYLQYPWKFPDSMYYRYLLNYPPRGINFVNVKKERFGIITSSLKFKVLNKVKNIFRGGLELIKIPNLTYSFIDKVDLIHCAHCLSLNKVPWVVDIEHYWTFSASSKISNSMIGRNIIIKFLKRRYCKKILPWSFAAKESIEKAITKREILEKVEVIYPAIKIDYEPKKKRKHKVTLLFVGRYFYKKGGLLILETFKEVVRKFDVNCIFISATIPRKLKEKYKNYFTIYEFVKREKLLGEIFPNSDIFVYPGFGDTFGFAFLEAMWFGLPIVTVEGFARNEIVKNMKNGFVVKTPKNISLQRIGKNERKLIKKIVERTSLLIEDSSLRKKMGREGKRLVKRGKFSIRERNKKLKRVYEEAIKD